MRGISDLLTQSLKRHGIERQVTAARIIEVAQEILLSLVSESAKKDVRVLSFFGNALRIACRHPAAAQEVRRATPALLADMARAFPDRTIPGVETLLDAYALDQGRGR